MDDEQQFKVSQDYEIIPPQKKKAYLILVEEWAYIKGLVASIKDNTDLWHTIGSVLLGISGSGLLSAFTLDIPMPESDKRMPMPILVSWFAFISAGVTGGLSFYFAHARRSDKTKTAENAVQQMELIENRFKIEQRSTGADVTGQN
jgi:hypothetical protein